MMFKKEKKRTVAEFSENLENNGHIKKKKRTEICPEVPLSVKNETPRGGEVISWVTSPELSPEISPKNIPNSIDPKSKIDLGINLERGIDEIIYEPSHQSTQKIPVPENVYPFPKTDLLGFDSGCGLQCVSVCVFLCFEQTMSYGVLRRIRHNDGLYSVFLMRYKLCFMGYLINRRKQRRYH